METTEKNIRFLPATHFDSLIDFYDQLIKKMEGSPFHPKWELGVYPTLEELRHALDHDQVLVVEIDGKIAGAMIFNQNNNDGYENAAWKVPAAEDEIYYVHLLGINPNYQKQGLARELMDYAKSYARENGAKAIRLDVIEGNTPALKVYPALGFEEIGIVPLYYDDTGWMNFTLFEKGL